jgi:hypothetical protein
MAYREQERWMDNITLGEIGAYITAYGVAYIPWVLIVSLLIYAYIKGRKHKLAVPAAAPKEGRDWFKYLKYLRQKLWYKPRGFVMKKRKARERETAEDDIIAIRQLMVIEMAWLAGEITHKAWKRNVDRVAERFSRPELYHNKRLQLLKNHLKQVRKELGKPLTLEEAGIPPTGTKGEGEPAKVSLLSKVA